MSSDLDLLRRAAQEAGRLALAMQERGLRVQRKEGGSPVTDADIAVDQLLTTRLRAARPDYGWMSEETADDPIRMTKARVFMVDPIDGTTAYIKGRPWWVVSVAVAEEGRAVAGVIYNAALEETYEAAEGQGAMLNGRAIHCSTATSLETCAMLGDANAFAAPGWPEPWPAMRVESRNSVAYRMALVACGGLRCGGGAVGQERLGRGGGAGDRRRGRRHLDRPQGPDLVLNGPAARHPSLICCAPALHR